MSDDYDNLDTVHKFILKKEVSLIDITFILFTVDMVRYSNHLTRQEIDEATWTKILNFVNSELKAFLQREAKKPLDI